MYIAYSALQTPAIPDGVQQPEPNQSALLLNEHFLRYQAYQITCSKYRYEIAAIQKHIPGWQPSPPTP